METINARELSTPLLEGSAESNITFKVSKKKRKLPWHKLLATIYSLFLCWQLTGVCLYVVRAVTCFKHKNLTYKCEANAAFPQSAKVEFSWLVTRCLHIIFGITVLQNFADFPGYKAICRQLKFLPEFWSLLFLLLVASSRHAILFVLFDKALFHMLALLTLNDILRVTAVTVLNFTQLNTLRRHSQTTMFFFSKVTLMLIFTENLLTFVISVLQFAMNIEDFSQDEMLDSTDFQAMYSLIHHFATTYFDFKIMNFFWQKLFTDDKNVLSSHFSPHTLL